MAWRRVRSSGSLRTATGDEHGNKRAEKFWLAEVILVSQEALWFLELVSQLQIQIQTNPTFKSFEMYVGSTGKELPFFRTTVIDFIYIFNQSMSLFLDCLSLKIKAVYSFETSVYVYQSAGRNISEDLNLHRCENFSLGVLRFYLPTHFEMNKSLWQHWALKIPNL